MMPEDRAEANAIKLREYKQKAAMVKQINDLCTDTAKRQKAFIEGIGAGFPFDILIKDEDGKFKIPQPTNERDKLMFAAGQLSLAFFIKGATDEN